LQTIANAAHTETNRLQTDYDESKARIEECDRKAEEMDQLIQEIESRKTQEPKSRLDELNKVMKEKEKAEAVARSDLKGLHDSVKDDEKRLNALKKTLANVSRHRSESENS
jgi:hypothetical protein